MRKKWIGIFLIVLILTCVSLLSAACSQNGDTQEKVGVDDQVTTDTNASYKLPDYVMERLKAEADKHNVISGKKAEESLAAQESKEPPVISSERLEEVFPGMAWLECIGIIGAGKQYGSGTLHLSYYLESGESVHVGIDQYWLFSGFSVCKDEEEVASSDDITLVSFFGDSVNEAPLIEEAALKDYKWYMTQEEAVESIGCQGAVLSKNDREYGYFYRIPNGFVRLVFSDYSITQNCIARFDQNGKYMGEYRYKG